MNALHVLERHGFRFELTATGEIVCENTRPDKDVPPWLRPRLSELHYRRDELTLILKRRQEWIEVYDEWEKVAAADGEDPARDDVYLLRLKALAIAGQMPCYAGGQINLGAEGWERVTERLMQSPSLSQSLSQSQWLSLSQSQWLSLSQSQWQSRIDNDSDGDSDKKIDSDGDGDGDKKIDSDSEESSFVVTKKETNEMGIKIEQTTYDAVPTGDYKAVITGIEQVEGKFGPQLQIKCEINAGPHAGNTFLCWVSPRFSPKSRLYEWVEAVLAMPVPRTYTFDSDHLIGREVIATLVVRELDGGGEVNRVDRVRSITNYELRITN